MTSPALLVLCSLSAARLPAGPDVVSIDARATGHTWLGFGANIWPGDTAVEPALRDLKMAWVRLWAGMAAGTPGPEATRDEFDAYWARHPAMPGVRTTAAMLARHRIKTVLCIGSPPAEWLAQAYHLKPEYHQAFARNWGAAVAAHIRAGLRPKYVELYNEPDGFWGVHVSPEENAAFVRRVRAELDARGLRDVGICGPGTAHADWGESGDRYVEALGSEALAALAAWSNHAWEWKPERINAEGGEQYLREAWPSVMGPILRKDPGRRRPVLVTEFATKACVFNGARYPDPDAGQGEGKASDTPAYAVRVVQNALHLISGGANALMVWEGADQEWSPHEWGLMTRPSRGSRRRPVYEALRTAMPELRVGGRVLAPVMAGGALAAAAVRQGSRLTVVVANGGAREATVRIDLNGARSVRVLRARAFRGGRACAAAPAVSGRSITDRMPGSSTLTVVLAVR